MPGVEVSLKLSLSPSQIAPVSQWLDVFSRNEPLWADYPAIKESTLHISVPCFPFFLGYVAVEDSNEFDVHRLRTQGRRALEQGLEHAVSSSLRRLYAKALENLEEISVGEFLDDQLPADFS